MTQAFNLSQFANKVNTSGQADLATAVTGTLPLANLPTITVPYGGTGVTTLTTAYGVLAAGTTATGAVQNIGTGTTGQILTSNGTSALPTFQAAPVAGGMTFLTTIATTSGNSVTSASVVLTTYKQVMFIFNNISQNGVSGSFQMTDPNATKFTLCNNPANAARGIGGAATIDLSTGVMTSTLSENMETTLPNYNISATTNRLGIGKTTFSTSTTSFTFSITSGTFDAGSITVYGIK
jgi:hypothetical protein